ncbi:hypothetical protein [Desulfogranum mediterraneum]|uniref:hypothetical protein n=1 Tax=Desulfogranum mediterraneum TaxID=160661 RepID=UPI00068408C2|nr:hypothetical protein [Desulfogranum mediterraneum]
MKRPPYRQHCWLLLWSILCAPGSAWALQPHSAPEGLYVHQMSHLLFMGALIYLYWHTRRTPELSGRGWRYLQTFCLLFAGWNLLALVGHEAIKFLSPGDFIAKSSWNEQIVGPISPIKMVYFITKMDHLLYVPALVALVVGLRSFSQEVLREKEQ